MKNKQDVEKTVEQIQNKEKLVTRSIVVIAVCIGVLLALLLTGLVNLFN